MAVRFNQLLENTAATQQALKVFSQQAGGNKAGLATISGTTLTFNPTTDFKAGETVAATVTTACAAATAGRVWPRAKWCSFTTATVPSAGTFGISQAVPVGDSPNNVAVGDLDGDGDLDFVTANYSGNSLSIRLNNGGGSFSGSQTISSTFYIYNVTLGDVDNDGDLDLLLSYYGSQHTVSIRLNDGQGGFTNGQDIQGGSYFQGPVLGDVDADGDLDFVVNNYNPNAPLASVIAVRLNNGNGTFTNGADVATGGVPVLGDVDNDGDLDLLVTNSTSSTVSVQANNGPGVFSLRQQVPSVPGPPA